MTAVSQSDGPIAVNNTQTTKGETKVEKNKPETTIRVGGGVKAAVWKNPTENGARYSVTIARTYKDGNGDLQDTTRFRRSDLLFVAKAAERAFDFLLNGRDD